MLALLVLVTMLVAAVRRGAGVGRGSVVLATTLFFLVPSAIVALTLKTHGGIWQGRYSLPFTVGIITLAGLVLDHVRWRSDRRDARPVLLAVSMLAVAQVVSVVHVQLAELDRPVSADDGAWVHPPTLVTGLLMALACVGAGWIALRLARGAQDDEDARSPVPASAGQAVERR